MTAVPLEVPSAPVLARMIESGLQAAADNSARSLQKGEGVLGPSDIGFCRHKAALVTTQVPPSDAREKLWAAVVGSALHDKVEALLGQVFPDWIIERERVTAVLPNGSQISGTADILVPDWNMVIDLKSKDGFEWVKREGISQNHRYQTFLYADGACRAGILDRNHPVYACVVYLDRSGTVGRPHVEIEEVNWGLADEVSSWVDDVIYGVKQGNLEEVPRDVPASVCEKICEFYTTCRGGLPATDSELIQDEHLLEAVDMLVEGREMEKAGKAMTNAARKELDGVNGSTGDWQVRSTFVPPSEVGAYTRKGYDKVEVVKVRKRG